MIGTDYDVMPVPVVPEHTRHVPAGALSIGIEYRHVDAGVIDAAYGASATRTAGEDTPQPPILQDEGVSLHVCDGMSGAEYLRFDLFGDNPHYHYIHPGEFQLVVPFDRAASGDMLTWALGCLRSRLPEMLEFAGAGSLAAQVTAEDIDAALPAVVTALGAAAPTAK